MRSDTVHLVDEHGLVWCPRQSRDVDADRCLTCAELLVGVAEVDGTLREIRCHRPPSTSATTPWAALLPDALRR